jgi:hypothetical protein
MNRTLPAAVVLFSLIFAATGCALTTHVRGLAGPEESMAVPPGSRICVATDPDVQEPQYADTITDGIELLLSNKGYVPASSNEAEYFLFFDFECKPLITRVRLEPIGGGRSGISTERKQGPFDLTLSLKLVEAGAYHETGLEEWVWVGGAILGNAPTESPKFVDLLLVAGMKYFPKETEKVVEVKLHLYDRRARQLRRLRLGREVQGAP